MSEKENEEDKHLNDLVERIKSDFKDRVESETIPANVLLKGHLLIENILEECLASFDVKYNIRKAGFYEKIVLLSQIKASDKFLSSTLEIVSKMLFCLNDIRNNLAHDLSFSISATDINKIGINLGSEYIVKKYETGHKKIRENLLFVLNNMVHKLGVIIYIKIDEKREERKSGHTQKN